MAAFAGPYCKRHILFSNHRSLVDGVNVLGGYLPREKRPSGKLVKKDGKGRFTGLKKELKNSQTLVFIFYFI